MADGYVPDSDDLSALRLLTGLPCAGAEHARRLRLRERCAELAEAAVRRRLDAPVPPQPPRIASVVSGGKVADFARARQRDRAVAPAIPHRRGGTMSNQPAPTPREDDRPVRPVPTPADLWPRGVRPKPATPPAPHPDDPEERPTGTG
ncbi:hypothetical protein ACFP3V_07260 [Streptacidiphilus monticola]|uniref:Uncharacterized protein n=1 Tax=Streptacidiphilus monticola TaxID=2161674 RepID=A0ABW1FYP8_9ACTN